MSLCSFFCFNKSFRNVSFALAAISMRRRLSKIWSFSIFSSFVRKKSFVFNSSSSLSLPVAEDNHFLLAFWSVFILLDVLSPLLGSFAPFFPCSQIVLSFVSFFAFLFFLLLLPALLKIEASFAFFFGFAVVLNDAFVSPPDFSFLSHPN